MSWQIQKREKDESLEKLRALLKKLFELDMPELDFGIYRIMNYRRKEVEEFIERDLLQAVEKEFARYRAQSEGELVEKIEKKREEIKRLETQLDEKILRDGDIEEKFHGTPLAREYLELKTQLDELEVTESVKNQVFNDLYNFFSRYYEDGDFISKRRYSSRQHRYAIPYDGEEVKLYWANFDQYYVKTGEVFKDYEFRLNGWRIIFRTTIAETDVGNVKGERKYFVLHPERPIEIDKESKTCAIQFEYRKLTDEDLRHFGVKAKSGEEKKTGIRQEELDSLIEKGILGQVSDKDLKSILSTKEDEKTMLGKHLHRYTRKITSDFFIHKNLKAFLERELDYFIKTELIDLNNLEPKHITRAKVVEGIGKRIIEFLYQIEDFQKKLWEKKKFVINTDYIITTDLIPQEFHEEILSNERQLKEWEKLEFGDVKKNDLIRKKLPVDTKHFTDSFKEKLLEKLADKGNIDDLVDGVLIKSDNFQALRLLGEKYKEKIKCICIDPPYNTGGDEFLFKDNYQHSSWITMMENRLSLAKELMKNDGVIFVNIDDNEVSRLKILMDNIFDASNFISSIIWRKKRGHGRGAMLIIPQTEYVLNYAKNIRALTKYEQPLSEEKLKYYKYRDKKGKYARETLEHHTPRGAYVRRTLQYGLILDGKKIYCTTGQWLWKKDRVLEEYEKGNIDIVMDENGRWRAYKKIYLDIEGRRRGETPISLIDEENTTTNFATIELKNILPDMTFTAFPKPTTLIKKMIRFSASEDGKDLILDFFAGSGTTAHSIIDLNRQDGGHRKYILIEIGGWFETVLLPRIKKVVFCKNWKDGKPADNDGVTHIIKYHVLEQYEDTLHNIEFLSEEKGRRAAKLFGGNEYLKHFLQYETKGSAPLLNVNQFENPFEYKLKVISSGKGEEIANVDLVETFNYLIGLRVNKYKFLRENGRKYVFVFGERSNRRVAVVWRPTKAIDLEKDKQIIDGIITSFRPDEVYINGNALVENYKVIETEFRTRMGV